MRNVGTAAGVAILGTLVLCLVIVNMLGGVVSGIWLLILGEWRLVLLGFALSFAMPTAWFIAALPAFGIGALMLASDTPSRWTVGIIGFIASLWQAALIGIWTFAVFVLFMRHAEGAATVALLLWGYSTTMAPLAYMARNDDGAGTALGLMLAVVGYGLLAVMYLFDASMASMITGLGLLVLGESVLCTALGVAVTPPKQRHSLNEPPLSQISAMEENVVAQTHARRTNMNTGHWYFAEEGTTHGPLTEDELRQRWRDGQLHSETLVWQEGTPNWIKAGEVPGLLPPAVPPPWPPPLPAHQQGAVRYAGFWKRFAAILIDFAVMFGATFIIFFLLGLLLVAGGNGSTYSGDDWEAIGNCFGIITWWLYFAGMESSGHQGTLGKLALGIKVTDLSGQPIGFGRATGRHFSKILSGIILGIGYLLAAFTPKKQGLHDMIAGCVVVNK